MVLRLVHRCRSRPAVFVVLHLSNDILQLSNNEVNPFFQKIFYLFKNTDISRVFTHKKKKSLADSLSFVVRTPFFSLLNLAVNVADLLVRCITNQPPHEGIADNKRHTRMFRKRRTFYGPYRVHRPILYRLSLARCGFCYQKQKIRAPTKCWNGFIFQLSM